MNASVIELLKIWLMGSHTLTSARKSSLINSDRLWVRGGEAEATRKKVVSVYTVRDARLRVYLAHVFVCQVETASRCTVRQSNK